MSKIIKRPPYEVLGIEAGESVPEIKRKYKKLIREFTPENSPEKFMEIREAYDFIIRPSGRVLSFPIYQTPVRELKAQGSSETANKLSPEILKDVFESPFNTSLELREYVDKHNFDQAGTAR